MPWFYNTVSCEVFVTCGHAETVAYLNGPGFDEHINSVYQQHLQGRRLRVRATEMSEADMLFAEALRSLDNRATNDRRPVAHAVRSSVRPDKRGR
jgi:hypothetical protein